MPPETIADVSRRVAERGEAAQSTENGCTVLVKRRFGPFRRGLLRALGLKPDLTVRLDTLGTAVWALIDGERTVAQIHAALRTRFPEQEDLGARLGKFLGAMVSRDLVKLR